MTLAWTARVFLLLGLTCGLTTACTTDSGGTRPVDARALAAEPEADAAMEGPVFAELADDERPMVPDPNAPFAQHIYRVGVGDVLRIVGDLEFLRGFGETADGGVEGTQIKEDGNIYLPRLGAVPAAGRTALEIQQDLQGRLLKFDKNAYVSVDMLQYRSQKFFIMGAVARPGPYPIDNSVTVVEGVAMAGGATEEALLDQSYLVRGSRVLPVSLKDIYRGRLEHNVGVRHGDLFYVPSVSQAEVYVLGQVKDAGAVPFKKELSLVGAIAGAGGLSDQGDWNVVRVFRGDLYSPRCYTVTLCDAMKAGAAIKMHPGDRVYIGRSSDAEYDRILKIVSPLLQGVSLAAVTAKTFAD